MKLKIVSDFHVEFMEYNKIKKIIDRKFPVSPDDKDTILCCAGDIGLFEKYASTYKPFFEIMSKRFREVICISGNHSYYHSSVWGAEKEYWKLKKLPKNVHYLQNKTIVIDGVAFIGSTLWTDFHKSDPIAMMKATQGMNDFRIIKKASSTPNDDVVGLYGQVISSNRLSPEDTVVRHNECLSFIEQELMIHSDKKCVVISHHAPSANSVGSMYRGDILNAAYYTDLSEFILNNTNIKYWFHGHMHMSFRYNVGDTEIVCNPFGYYYQDENKGFDPNLTIEME